MRTTLTSGGASASTASSRCSLVVDRNRRIVSLSIGNPHDHVFRKLRGSEAQEPRAVRSLRVGLARALPRGDEGAGLQHELTDRGGGGTPVLGRPFGEPGRNDLCCVSKVACTLSLVGWCVLVSLTSSRSR